MLLFRSHALYIYLCFRFCFVCKYWFVDIGSRNVYIAQLGIAKKVKKSNPKLLVVAGVRITLGMLLQYEAWKY